MAQVSNSAFVCGFKQQMEGRWFIEKDMNCDGAFTISDIGLWLKWVFFLPGDGALWLLLQRPGLANFLELSPASYSGWGTGLASGVLWLLLAMGLWDTLIDWLNS